MSKQDTERLNELRGLVLAHGSVKISYAAWEGSEPGFHVTGFDPDEDEDFTDLGSGQTFRAALDHAIGTRTRP